MTAATLLELAKRADREPGEVIPVILERLDSGDREVFLAGLSERVVAGDSDVDRWVGSWLISVLVAADPHFCAHDLEAEQLIGAGKMGPGITGSELRSRFGR